MNTSELTAADPRIQQLESENASLRAQVDRLEATFDQRAQERAVQLMAQVGQTTPASFSFGGGDVVDGPRRNQATGLARTSEFLRERNQSKQSNQSV